MHSREKKNTILILYGSLYILFGSLSSFISWLWPSVLLWPFWYHSDFHRFLGIYHTHFDGIFLLHTEGSLFFLLSSNRLRMGTLSIYLFILSLEPSIGPHSLFLINKGPCAKLFYLAHSFSFSLLLRDS